jgi:uncharacterized protein
MPPSTGHENVLPKVVIDTNVLVSALLFEGITNRLVPLWHTEKFVYLISKPILEEYIQTLSYPKFQLTEKEIKFLIEDNLLPFIKPITTTSWQGIPKLKDVSDRKFLQCAVAGKANYLITGDKELLSLREIKKTKIVSPRDFLYTMSRI